MKEPLTLKLYNIFPFHSVVVRPITPSERVMWDGLMSEHHYLGFKSLVGESIRYVAELQGRWLALLGWAAAALKCQSRDSWIGWSQAIQWQRLELLVNNSRFLILPGIYIPNLASKILSLNLKRLSNDWQHIHGHPVLIAETFVDTDRFTGACYKAAAWLYLGQTSGYGKHARHYVHHGQSKAVFVRPLSKKALIKLRDPHPDPHLVRKEKSMQLSQKQASDLIEVLRTLPDPRHKRGVRHRSLSIIALSICAVICGCRSYTSIAEWTKHCSQKMLDRLWCRKKGPSSVPPSEPTVRRQLQKIDAEQVDMAISDWIGRLASGNVIGIDGKTLRGARREDGTKVHLISAFIHQQGITIAPKKVPVKSNEIPAAIPLLKPLDLKDKIITADALHTQKDLARFLVQEKQADYCFTVKDNQANLKEAIAYLGLNEGFPPEHETCEKAHGRLEIRKIWTSTDLNDYVDFPFCGQVACIERHTEELKTGKKRSETVYLITSASPDKVSPKQLLELNRGHWTIENKSHYVRDVTFDEDRSQIRTKTGPRMMAILRNLAISLLRLADYTNIAEATRHMAAKPYLSLRLIGI